MHRLFRRSRSSQVWFRLLLAVGCLALLLPPAGPTLAAGQAPASSGVQLEGGQFHYRYLVGGVPTVIRGIGYNAIYHELPPDARLTRLNRDFAMMQAAGINTIVSWYPEEFDQTLLDAAHAYGLGVVMPFDLPTTFDYADATIRSDMKQAVLDWVAVYRDHPAIRIWGIGNEVMLNMDPDQASAFADFLADVVAAVREADPDHPVVYREAEDVFVPYIRDALGEYGVTSGFIYGMNFYTPRLEPALRGWANHGFDVPVIVSEFAPAGVPRALRPDGLRAMWKTIRERPEVVLGGAPYVWTTEGPEAVDRLFGFVDDANRPVDQSLAALREIYDGQGDLAKVTVPLGVVPLLVGQPEAEAREDISRAGLGEVAVRYVGRDGVDDPALFGRVPPGIVLRQEPAAGTEAPGQPVTLVVLGKEDGTPPGVLPLDRLLDDVIGRAATYAAAIHGVTRDDLAAAAASQRAQGLHQQMGGVEAGAAVDPKTARLADLVAWSKVLSDVGVDGQLPFLGAREALPLLAGMSRWGFGDAESLDTAQRFLRDVLVRDLLRTTK